MKYNVTIKTTFSNGMTSESNVPLETILSTFRTGQQMRFNSWIDSDEQYQSTESPYIVKTLEFDKEGKVKFIALKEVPHNGY